MTKKTKEIESFKKLFTCHQDIVHSVHIHTGGVFADRARPYMGPGCTLLLSAPLHNTGTRMV